jgi:hypothetical protein
MAVPDYEALWLQIRGDRAFADSPQVASAYARKVLYAVFQRGIKIGMELASDTTQPSTPSTYASLDSLPTTTVDRPRRKTPAELSVEARTILAGIEDGSIPNPFPRTSENL